MNAKKTQIIVFSRNGHARESWGSIVQTYGTLINELPETTFLGVTVDKGETRKLLLS